MKGLLSLYSKKDRKPDLFSGFLSCTVLHCVSPYVFMERVKGIGPS